MSQVIKQDVRPTKKLKVTLARYGIKVHREPPIVINIRKGLRTTVSGMVFAAFEGSLRTEYLAYTALSEKAQDFYKDSMAWLRMIGGFHGINFNETLPTPPAKRQCDNQYFRKLICDASYYPELLD